MCIAERYWSWLRQPNIFCVQEHHPLTMKPYAISTALPDHRGKIRPKNLKVYSVSLRSEVKNVRVVPLKTMLNALGYVL